MNYVTANQMKQIEKKAAEAGLSYLQMMENAGKTAADKIIQDGTVLGKIAVIAVGKGNNGGDGYVVARHLSQAGAGVVVLMIDGLPKTADAHHNFELCRQAGIELLQFETDKSAPLLEGADIIVDAVYGAGFHGCLKDRPRAAAQQINRAEGKVYALDLPSGVNADNGEADRSSVRADVTIVFDSYKCAHADPAAIAFCGRLYLADIGIPEHCHTL